MKFFYVQYKYKDDGNERWQYSQEALQLLEGDRFPVVSYMADAKARTNARLLELIWIQEIGQDEWETFKDDRIVPSNYDA
jgi:hypothetical protein